MASNICKQYVFGSLDILAEHIRNNKINDFSYENLKKIIEDSDILNNKIKITNNSKVGGWHAFISKHRNEHSMKNLAEIWNNMNEEEKEPYKKKALIMREEDKIKKESEKYEILKKIKVSENIKKEKAIPKHVEEKPRVSDWVLFKKSEISKGNLDLNNIKQKYMELSSEELEELKKRVNNDFITKKNNYEKEENSNIKTNEYKRKEVCIWNIYKELQFEQGIKDMGLIKENYNKLTDDEIERYKKMNTLIDN